MIRHRVLLGCLLAVPWVASAQPMFTPEYRRFQLDNGLDVVLHRLANVPAVTVMTTYRVGSANEVPGRTGLAHLFEHLLFHDTRHVKSDQRDKLLVANGGGANAATTADFTVFATWGAANAVETLIYLDAERMIGMTDGLTQQAFDIERDVVKNERRERFDNAPYGTAFEILGAAIYPEGHPYHHSSVGSMADLDAATLSDAVSFYKTYYGPNNAQVVIVGDIDLDKAQRYVEKWYGAVPRGVTPPPLSAPRVRPSTETRMLREENVQLPRLFIAWPTALLGSMGDAAMNMTASMLNANGSRLRTLLVNELQLAQSLQVAHDSNDLQGEFYITVTARPGKTLDEIHRVIQKELRTLQNEPPPAALLARLVRANELSFYLGIESTGARGDFISNHLRTSGFADFFTKEVDRYRILTPRDISEAALNLLPADRAAVLSIVPTGRGDLAVVQSTPVRSTP